MNLKQSAIYGHRDRNSVAPAYLRGCTMIVFALMTWYSVRSLFILPPAYNHIPTAVLVLAAVQAVARRHRLRLTRLQKLIGLGFLMLTIQSLLFHGTIEILFAGSCLGGMLAYSLLFADKRLEPGLIPAFVLTVVAAEFLASVFLLGPQPGLDTGNAPALIPIWANGWRISLAPWGNTIHFTGELGVLLLFSALLYWRRKNIQLSCLLAIAGLYLVVFAGSRAACASVLLLFLLFAVNRKTSRPWASAVVIGAVLIATYGANLAIDRLPRFEGLVASLTKLTPTATDLTSSRNWLWEYHLALFRTHPWVGSGVELAARFQTGARVESGAVAQASAESFYTAMLASYGVFGLLFPLIHIGIIVVAFTRKDLPSILLSAHLLLSTAANSSYGNVYGTFNPFIFAFLAPCVGGYVSVSRRRDRPPGHPQPVFPLPSDQGRIEHHGRVPAL